MTTVEINNLCVGYGSQPIVSGITASLNSGKLTCLLGNNGIGKSTLLRTLSGFQRPLEGEIKINGTPISQLSHHTLAKTIGVVLTEKVNIHHFTTEELVGLGRSPYTGFWGNLSLQDQEIIHQSIEMVGIESLAKRQILTLSDGERQKAMIAKTLAQQTPIIFLDEPTAFLDFQSKVDTLQLLAHLAHSKQKTILLSTHEIELALQIADKIWLLDKNSQLQTGTPTELSENGIFADFIENIHIEFDSETQSIKMKNNFS